MRALLLTYVFPPVGGVGTERVRKLAKYLPSHGVTPTVLTAANPSVPLFDPSSERDVSPSLPILRARTFEPDYKVKQAVWAASSRSGESADATKTHQTLGTRVRERLTRLGRAALIPDPQVLWQPDVYRVLATELIRHRPEVLFITAPPFSSFLAAPLARLRPGTGVVLDYRDEWQTLRTHYEMLASTAAEKAGEALERALLRSAHVVTTATEAFRENLLARHSFLDPARVVAITNGYDPDDFPSSLSEPPQDKFVLTYAGTVYKLTSARGLLAGVRLLHEREPELAKSLEVRFLGRIVDTERDAFEGTESLGVRVLGFVPKDEVIRQLSASHMTMCILPVESGNERVLSGKVFDLMYVRRPVLTLAPESAMSELMTRHRLGTVVPPNDPDAIARFLVKTLRTWKNGDYSYRAAPVDIDRYDRRVIAGQFAEVFRSAVALARV